jgi:hypothetical protein
MNHSLLAALAVIESMMIDAKDEYAADLAENPELATALEMAHRQLHNGRVRFTQDYPATVREVEESAPIRLTDIEKWVLRSLSMKPQGVSGKMLRAQHDRLISNKLIEEQGEVFVITAKGLNHLNQLIKLPGMKTGALPIHK